MPCFTSFGCSVIMVSNSNHDMNIHHEDKIRLFCMFLHSSSPCNRMATKIITKISIQLYTLKKYRFGAIKSWHNSLKTEMNQRTFKMFHRICRSTGVWIHEAHLGWRKMSLAPFVSKMYYILFEHYFIIFNVIELQNHIPVTFFVEFDRHIWKKLCCRNDWPPNAEKI